MQVLGLSVFLHDIQPGLAESLSGKGPKIHPFANVKLCTCLVTKIAI